MRQFNRHYWQKMLKIDSLRFDRTDRHTEQRQRSTADDRMGLSVCCFRSEEIGHFARNCPRNLQNSPVSTTKSPKETGQRSKLNKRNEKGETSLHSATIKGDVKLVGKLIRQGADVNISDFAGWTPLHEACNIGWVEIAKYLLKAGATVNVKGVKSGANPLLTNSGGKTPIDIAKNDEIRRILKQEIIPSSSDDSTNEEPRSPTSPESNCDEINHDEAAEDVHSTSKDTEHIEATYTFDLDVPQLICTEQEDTEDKDKNIEILDIAQAEESDTNQDPVLSTMRKASPPQHNNIKGHPSF
ncbi:Ankyrin repeat domain-containing protein 12 [Nymphon striatum]|nr:Ankyrin repeat domain-containing protein 12 [Nymphon striatum]